MLVSTFEILLKPQLPKVLPPTVPAEDAQLSRIVIQGYFLTLANVNNFDITVSLMFHSALPSNLNLNDFIDAVDITGTNVFGQLTPAGSKRAVTTFVIPARDTALFILQPDFITKPQILTDSNFEARGYVEVAVTSFGSESPVKLLVTPEHRGTFFKNLASMTEGDVGLDQIAYALPVANGGLLEFKK